MYYQTETLINGNISECIRSINEDVIECGAIGTAIDIMIEIKELVPEKYKYVISKLRFDPIATIDRKESKRKEDINYPPTNNKIIHPC